MSLILGSANGVENVGETNWVAEYGPKYRCRHCGPACNIWTYDFLNTLRHDHSDWFDRIAERLRTEILVSAEKSFALIERFDPIGDHQALILYKSPENFWNSIRKRPWREETIEVALRRWTRTYSKFLEDSYCPGRGKMFVNVEEMMANPESLVPYLLDVLELDYDRDTVPEYWKIPQHYLGGNFNVYDKLRDEGEDALRIRPIKPNTAATQEFRDLCFYPAYDVLKELNTRNIFANFS